MCVYLCVFEWWMVCVGVVVSGCMFVWLSVGVGGFWCVCVLGCLTGWSCACVRVGGGVCVCPLWCVCVVGCVCGRLVVFVCAVVCVVGCM